MQFGWLFGCLLGTETEVTWFIKSCPQNQTFTNVHIYISNLLPILTIPVTPSNFQRLTFCQLVEEAWKDYIQIQLTQREKWEALGLSCNSAAGLQWGSLHSGCWQELHHQCSCPAQRSRTELLMCSELPSKQALHGNYMTIATWRCTISLYCEELESTYYMWQSRIQIEYFFVAYFKRITEFDAL